MAGVGLACSCVPPPGLCGYLQPGMVGFVGKAIASEPAGPDREEVTFRIEEGLWGVEGRVSIRVVLSQSLLKDKSASWFVLARRLQSATPKRGELLIVDSACCPYGLLLPAEHAWAAEFRRSAQDRRVAQMNVELHSHWIPIENTVIVLRGEGRGWREISRSWPVPARLAPGDYRIELTNLNFRLAPSVRRISILPGACTTLQIAAEPESSIAGAVLLPPGGEEQKFEYFLEGVLEEDSSAWNQALRSFREAWQAWAGWGAPARKHAHYIVQPEANGRFRIAVLPGKYRMIARSGNRHESVVGDPPYPEIFYPGVLDPAAAGEIVVRAEQQVGDVQFRFPELRAKRTVEVVLVRPNGLPAAGEIVPYIGKHPNAPYRTTGWAQEKTDSQGRARFAIFPFLDYELHLNGRVSGDSRQIRAGSEAVQRRYVVQPAR